MVSMEVVRSVTLLLEKFPKDMVRFVPQLLPIVWTLFSGCLPAYTGLLGGQGGAFDDEGPAVYDADGDQVGLEPLVVCLLELVRAVASSPVKRVRTQLIEPQLGPLVFGVLGYMPMTSSQLQLWEEEPNQFIADEDDVYTYSVRNSCADLLVELVEAYGASALSAVVQAAEKHIAAAEEGLKARASDAAATAVCWRNLEGVLLAVGTVSGSLVDVLQKQKQGGKSKLQFDLPSFMEYLLGLVQRCSSGGGEGGGFLCGRALWCASELSAGLDAIELTRWWQACTGGLDPSLPLSVRLCACKAVGRLAIRFRKVLRVLQPKPGGGGDGKRAEEADGEAQQVVQQLQPLLHQLLPSALVRLVALVSEASAETVHLVLETIHQLLLIDNRLGGGHATCEAEAQLSPLCLALWIKCHTDPLLPVLVSGLVVDIPFCGGYTFCLSSQSLCLSSQSLCLSSQSLCLSSQSLCLSSQSLCLSSQS
jgi:hypothetical protein